MSLASRTPTSMVKKILKVGSSYQAILILSVVLIACFWNLLSQPQSFLSSGSSASSSLALIDSVQQLEHYRSSGELPYFSSINGESNRAGQRGRFMTHPLFFTLSQILPAGLSLTLLLTLHICAGSVAMFFLLKRLTFCSLTAIFGSLVFFLSGQILNAGSDQTSEIGLSLAAALVPVLILTLLHLVSNPKLKSYLGVTATLAFLSLTGDLIGIFFALALSALGAATFLCIGGIQFSKKFSWLKLSSIFVWGLALGAYRWLPAIPEMAMSSSWLESVRAPWWNPEGHIKLPFHLGAVTLIALAISIRNLTQRPVGKWILPVLGMGIAVTLFGPMACLPFLGFFLALGMIMAFEGQMGPRKKALQTALAATTLCLLVFEALPVHHETLQGKRIDQLVETPAWLEHLKRFPATGRIAFLGRKTKDYEAPLALSGRKAWDSAESFKDINHAPNPKELAEENVRFLVSDLPDWKKRYVLIKRVREDGKYLYRNPYWAGPVWWKRLDEPGTVPTLNSLNQGQSNSIIKNRLLGWRQKGDRFEMELVLGSPSMVYVDLPAHSGWSAKVGSSVIPLETKNSPHEKLSLHLPMGRSDVIFTFQPPWLEAGFLFSALSLLLVPIVLLTTVLKEKLARPRAYYAPSQRLVLHRPKTQVQAKPKALPEVKKPEPVEVEEEVTV